MTETKWKLFEEEIKADLDILKKKGVISDYSYQETRNYTETYLNFFKTEKIDEKRLTIRPDFIIYPNKEAKHRIILDAKDYFYSDVPTSEIKKSKQDQLLTKSSGVIIVGNELTQLSKSAIEYCEDGGIIYICKNRNFKKNLEKAIISILEK
jgi:hypothetical protein